MDKESDAKKALFYSVQRIDLLLISISGAGIFACWEIFKYMHEQKMAPCFCGLKISVTLFVTTIILNFISQFVSYQTHYTDLQGKKDLADTLNKCVIVLNWITVITMITGLCFLLFFAIYSL